MKTFEPRNLPYGEEIEQRFNHRIDIPIMDPPFSFDIFDNVKALMDSSPFWGKWGVDWDCVAWSNEKRSQYYFGVYFMDASRAVMFKMIFT